MKTILKTRVVKHFPLADRATNISPINWYCRSVPDLLEDKHEARANLINANLEIVREKAKPIYLAKSGAIKNMRALESAQANDVVEVENVDAIRPMIKESISQDVEWILNILDQSAQESTATPDIQQGVMMNQQRTASELNLVASGSKNRYGMTARIFGTSMKLFWANWYNALQKYWDKKIHSKMVEISGVY